MTKSLDFSRDVTRKNSDVRGGERWREMERDGERWREIMIHWGLEAHED